MSKKKIYISLPITGRDFDEVESEILYVSGVLEMKGYRVVTPIDFDVNPDLDKPYQAYIIPVPKWDYEFFMLLHQETKIIDIEVKQNKENMEEKKLNLRPFDLEAAKAGKPVCTRDGRKARIICFDAKCNKPIVALIYDCNKETVLQYLENGRFFVDQIDKYDLMMFPQKKEGWVNVYKSYNVGKKIPCMASIYPTKEEAKKSSVVGFDYVDTVKIEWEE